MKVEHQAQDKVDVFRVVGRVDSNTAGEFGKALKEKIEDGRANLIVNLSGVEFFSSAGIRELIDAQKMAQDRPVFKGKVVIAEASDYIREVFQIAALTSLFIFFDTEADAVRALSM